MNESKVRKLKWIFVKLRVCNLNFCLFFFFFLGGGVGLLIIYGSGQVPNPSTTKKTSSPNSLSGQEKPEPIGAGTKQVLATRDPPELFGTQSR